MAFMLVRRGVVGAPTYAQSFHRGRREGRQVGEGNKLLDLACLPGDGSPAFDCRAKTTILR